MALDISEVMTAVGKVMNIANKAKDVEAGLPADATDLDKGLAIAEAVFPDVVAFIKEIRADLKD